LQDSASDAVWRRLRQDELSKYEGYLGRELPRLVREELNHRVLHSSSVLEEYLRSQLIEIVRNCQEKVFRSYQDSNADTVDTMMGPNQLPVPDKEAADSNAGLPALAPPAEGARDPPWAMVNSLLAAYAPMEEAQGEDVNLRNLVPPFCLPAGFDFSQTQPSYSDSGYSSQKGALGSGSGGSLSKKWITLKTISGLN
jgi:hypothetical protein